MQKFAFSVMILRKQDDLGLRQMRSAGPLPAVSSNYVFVRILETHSLSHCQTYQSCDSEEYLRNLQYS